MSVEYLYNSSGFYIAFREEIHIFDPVGNHVGWEPWGDGEIFESNGTYLGHIVEGGRFYRMDKIHQSGREPSGCPRPPIVIRIPPDPSPALRVRLPIGCHDIRLSAHV